MNYIKHLNGVYLQFSKDSRLNPTHISLYIALFQVWNSSRFCKEFYINREEVMKFSKIGSKSTYHRCIKELSNWQYIVYYPSHNPFKGSRIKMFIFETTDSQVVYQNSPNREQAEVSYINNNKLNKNNNKLELPQNEKIVIKFFKEKNWPKIDAQKFYNHYLANGWKLGGKSNIINWHAAAQNWMLKADEMKLLARSQPCEKSNKLPLNHFQNNLHTNNNKNYNEPL